MLDYLIMYEHKARELNSDCLIKAELERRGYSVKLEHTIDRQLLKYHFFSKPKVILVMSLYDDLTFEKHVNDIVGYHKKVVNLQWEQIGDVQTRGKEFVPRGVCKEAVHICWSKTRKDLMIDNGSKNAILTGPIQMDFLRPEFKTFYYSREQITSKYGLKDGKIIMYVSSFSYINLSEERIKTLSERTNLDISKRLKEGELAQEKTLDIFEEFLMRNKNDSLIYRPHPGEYIVERLKIMERKYDNFYVISDYGIQQWIQTADIVVTWVSTAISEVYFAKKKCVILQPTRVEANKEILYNNARICSNYCEFESEINTDTMQFPVRDAVMKENYFFPMDGFAYKRICDLLEEVYKTKKYDVMDYKKGLYLKASVKRWIKSIIMFFGITEKTFPFSYSKKISKWLSSFWNYKKITDLDVVSEEQIEELTRRIRGIIDKI